MVAAITRQIEVTVEAGYDPEMSKPEAGVYIFRYYIHIKNSGTESVQLLSRNWMITDGMGNHREVRGAGVVGYQPDLAPGVTFEYGSYCPLSFPVGKMQGTYGFVRLSDGEPFDVKIPEFLLEAPFFRN